MLYTIASEGLRNGIPEVWIDQSGKRHQLPHITPMNNADGFFIDAATLQFPEGCYAKGLDVWLGGEWHTDLPVWKSKALHLPSGKFDHVNKAQVWIRRRDQRLVVVDRFGALRLLVYEDEWRLKAPQLGEVVKYIYDHGLLPNASVRKISWAIRSIEVLERTFEVSLTNAKSRLNRRCAERA